MNTPLTLQTYIETLQGVKPHGQAIDASLKPFRLQPWFVWPGDNSWTVHVRDRNKILKMHINLETGVVTEYELLLADRLDDD